VCVLGQGTGSGAVGGGAAAAPGSTAAAGGGEGGGGEGSLGGVALAALGAAAARQQGRVDGQGGEEGEGEGTLALQDALGAAEAHGQAGGGGRKRAATPGRWRLAGSAAFPLPLPLLLLLPRRRLHAPPLQLQQPLQDALQGVGGAWPQSPPALCVVEGGQLSQAPGVERRGEEVRERVGAGGGGPWTPSSSLPAGVGGKVIRGDDLRAQVQLRGNGGGGGGGGRRRKSFRVGQIPVTVCVLSGVFRSLPWRPVLWPRAPGVRGQVWAAGV